ncbi:MAG: 2-oxo acid dehydrogenase subunit E2, partial [Pseudomonadota bacterium]
ARRLAETHNVDLISLQGSGPRGRIIKRDVDEAVASGAHQQSAARRATTARETAPPPDLVAPTPAPDLAVTRRTAPPVATVAPVDGVADASSDRDVLALYDPDTYDLVPHDGMRRTIATRLTQSKQTIPHFYQTVDIRLDQLLTARSRMNASAPTDGPRAFKLSVNDFVIKALALALQDVPAANASWTEGGMLRHRHSDVGVAVAVEGGLFTPIIRHAELKTLSEISNEMKDLANRARNRRLAPHEYQGGTTSISNLGMYGIKSFDAVINPPHATILAVGAGIEQPVVVEGQLTVATVMSCTLSADHRVVDGASGAELINAVKAYVEDPVRMLI